MSTHASLGNGISSRFNWRDALAFARAFPRIALRRKPHLAMTALARISAMDIRQTPSQQFFTASDGGQIAYRTYSGNDALHIVLVHGSACFGDQFHLLARHLSGEGVATVHTLDMRGHGQSTSKVDEFSRYGQDVIEFARMISAANPARKIVIGGHSAGGGLVINIARSEYAGGIAGWLLLAPFVAIADKSVRPYFGGWVKRFRRPKFIAVVMANALGVRRFNNSSLLSFDREACFHDPRYAREWPFNAIFGFGPGATDSYKKTIEGAPVLLLVGDADNCFLAQEYPRALKDIAPSGECRIIEELGHWDVLVDGQALDMCIGWLKEHFPESANRGGPTGEIRHANVG
jgi:alpha-beta hydrolase superfamily lysophospholipase